MTLVRSLAVLAVFICVLGLPTAAVIHVGSTGSDLLGDGSAEAPYGTIQHAVNMALGPDDTINVSAGTYLYRLTSGPQQRAGRMVLLK